MASPYLPTLLSRPKPQAQTFDTGVPKQRVAPSFTRPMMPQSASPLLPTAPGSSPVIPGALPGQSMAGQGMGVALDNPKKEGGPAPTVTPPGTPPATAPTQVLSQWEQLGYTFRDPATGLLSIKTPWNQTMTLEDALRRYYPDNPPQANEVPKWFYQSVQNERGYGKLQEWQQLPASIRADVQQYYDRALTSGYNPNVTNATPQSQYGQ